jgi:ABC-type uncharacterized transport system permease subunit
MIGKVLTSELIAKAGQLRQEGYTIREIADELNVPASRVERALLLSNNNTPVSPPMVEQSQSVAVEPNQQALIDEQLRIDAEKKRLAEWEQSLLARSTPYAFTSNQHAQELDALAKQATAIAESQRLLDDRKAELNQLLRSLPEREEQYEQFRLRARQEKLVNRYNGAIQELLDNCDDIKWSGDDVEDYLEKLEGLKTKTTQFCDANQIDERRLLMFKGLEFLINDVSEEQQEQTSGFFASSSVNFDYSDAYRDKIKAFMVERFDQQEPSLPGAVIPTPTTPAADPDDDDDFGEE